MNSDMDTTELLGGFEQVGSYFIDLFIGPTIPHASCGVPVVEEFRIWVWYTFLFRGVQQGDSFMALSSYKRTKSEKVNALEQIEP